METKLYLDSVRVRHTCLFTVASHLSLKSRTFQQNRAESVYKLEAPDWGSGTLIILTISCDRSTVKIFKSSDLEFLHGSSTTAEAPVIRWLILMCFMLQVFQNKEADATIRRVMWTNSRSNTASVLSQRRIKSKNWFQWQSKGWETTHLHFPCGND